MTQTNAPSSPGTRDPSPRLRAGAMGLALSRALSLVGLLAGSTLCAGDWNQRLVSAPDHPSPGHSWETLPAADGSNWTVYLATDDQYRLANPQGSITPLPAETNGHRQTAMNLAATRGGPVMLWREKRDGKQLYVKKLGEDAATALEIGGDSEPLARIEALAGPDDRLHVLWYGEKQAPNLPFYNLYYRNLDLQQAQVGAMQRVVEGIYPMMAMDENGNLLVTSWLSTEPPARMVASLRDRHTGEFSAPVTIAPVPDMAPLYRLTYHAGRFMVFWLALNDSPAFFQLRGFYSDDKGATWTAMTLPGLEGLDVQSLDVAMQGDQHLALAVSGRYRQDPDTAKFRVLVLNSTDKGATWGQPRSPLPVELDGKFNAIYPKLAFGTGEGELLLTWQDWREIRSRLYFSYSKNFGQEWLYSNLSLPADGLNAGLGYLATDLWRDANNTFHLISTLSLDDKMERYALVKNSFGVADLADLAAGTQKISRSTDLQELIAQHSPLGTGEAATKAVKTEEALRERAKAFWEAMVAGDHGKTYTFYEPFYRTNNSDLAYLKNMGMIKYQEAEIKEIHLEGNLASVEVSVIATVPKTRIKSTGEEVEKPAKNVTFKDTWVWVDDNWYREHLSKFHQKRWTRY